MFQHLRPVLIPKVTAGTERKHNRTNFTWNQLCLLAPAWSSAAMDKSIRALLLLLSLLSIHTVCVCGEGFALAPIELAPIPCNDKAVEKLSRLAATYINEDRTDGYKFALNRIANVHLHAQVSIETNACRGKPPGVVVILCQRVICSCLTREVGWKVIFPSVVAEISKHPCEKRKPNIDRFNQPWPIFMSVGSHSRRFVFCCQKWQRTVKLLIRNHPLTLSQRADSHSGERIMELNSASSRTYCGPQTLVWEPLDYIKDVKNSSNYISVQPHRLKTSINICCLHFVVNGFHQCMSLIINVTLKLKYRLLCHEMRSHPLSRLVKKGL